MKNVAYLRVSTDKQEFGIDAQRDAINAVANVANGCVFIDDGVSGNTPLDARPGLLAAIDALEKGDVLLVAKRDRLGRGDVLLIAMIERMVARKGARIQSAAGEGTDNDDAGSVLMRRMIDAFAEYELLIIKGRTRAALKAKKERAQRTGDIPIGYAVSAENPKDLVVNPSEAEAVAVAKELRSKGISYGKIGKRLEALGYKPRGYQWHRQTVKNMCTFIASEAMIALRAVVSAPSLSTVRSQLS